VSVEKYSPWEPTAALPHAGAAVCSAARGASALTEGGEGRGHIVAAARLQLVPVKHSYDFFSDCMAMKKLLKSVNRNQKILQKIKADQFILGHGVYCWSVAAYLGYLLTAEHSALQIDNVNHYLSSLTSHRC